MKRAIVTSLVVFFVVAGCGKKGGTAAKTAPGNAPAAASNREAGEFYDKLAAIRRQPELAFAEMSKKIGLGGVPTGEAANPDALLGQYAKTLQKARADLKAVPAPELALAPELRQAYDRALQAEEATLAAWGQITKSIPAIGTTVDPNELVLNLTRVSKEHERITAELVKAKQDFAKKHRLTNP
jgi:hypothetical protein